MLVVGWGGRIRTFDLLIQSQAPYRLATPQRELGDDTKPPATALAGGIREGSAPAEGRMCGP